MGVTLCAVENGILEIRLRDPLAIEKRVVPVFSTSPPQSLPSSKETPQPMSTISEDEGDMKTEPEKDNRVVLMKTEVPGFSSKDIECFINVDRTIEAKRGDRSPKSASRTKSTSIPSTPTANTEYFKSWANEYRHRRRNLSSSPSRVRATTARRKK